MEKETKGAWLIHHTKKLQQVFGEQEFEEVEAAGKSGILLSNLAASDESSDLNKPLVEAIAKASNIKKTEISDILNRLEKQKLIDISSEGGVSVLGISTSSVLGHTNDIFEAENPNNIQKASLELAEGVSDIPKGEKILKEYLSDSYKLSSQDTFNLFDKAEKVGLIDFENNEDEKLYFNGNLFRRDNMEKVQKILNSLKSDETRKINEVDQLLVNNGCLTKEKIVSILGQKLFEKLQTIGIYDFSTVSNNTESKTFVTKPGAFSKYGNPFEEDALDLAKAFVSSLYYGMNFSSSSRGKITMLKALMNKLISGYRVGPASAIGQDYRLLELKRVVKITPSQSQPNKFFMKLLKRDIGILALQVLESGEVTNAAMDATMTSSSVTGYIGPEQNRTAYRKKQVAESKSDVVKLLRIFRT